MTSQTDRITGLVGNAGMKVPVQAASTAALTLSGEQTVDGVALVTGDRILVKDQASNIDNGIYVVDTGDWERAKDADGPYDFVQGSMVLVYAGTTNGNKIFKCTSADTVDVGTDALTFAALSAELTGSSKTIWCGTATGTANALTLTPTTVVTAAELQAGLELVFKSGAAGNSAATTIAVSGLTAKAGQSNGNAMVGGEIEAAKWYRATYDGAAFQVERLAPAVLLDMFTASGQIAVATADGSVGAYKKAITPGGRLTLATATPVMTTDQAGQTTVYYTPYLHDIIELYDGSGWLPYQFTELSQATTDASKSPAAVANNSNYDIFVWNDAGTLRATRGPAWTSDTARGTGAGTTELEMVEGRMVNKIAITNGPAARRGVYVGTVRSNGSAQIDWKLGSAASGGGAAVIGVWNMYNRVKVVTNSQDTDDSWTYQSTTPRAMNNSLGNRVSMVIGLDEDGVEATQLTHVLSSATEGAAVAIGLDSTSSVSSKSSKAAAASSAFEAVSVRYAGNPGIGFHYLQALEFCSGAVNPCTFYGDAGASHVRQLLTAEVRS